MRERQFVSFRMDGRLYGVDILLIREIIRSAAYTPVEPAPAAVRGLLNLRGQIVTVVDLRTALGLPAGDDAPRRCMILKGRDDGVPAAAGFTPVEPLGLLVDGVGDVIVAADDRLERAPANTAQETAGHLAGVVKLPDDLLLVLDLQPILESAVGRSRPAVRQG